MYAANVNSGTIRKSSSIFATVFSLVSSQVSTYMAAPSRETSIPNPITSDRGEHNLTAHNTDDSESAFFSRAMQTDARYGIYTDNSVRINITYENHPAEIAEVLATLKPVDGLRYYVQPCLRGTREYIFAEVDQWIDDFEAHNILLISGNPGVGKSAIVSSIISTLAQRERFGSSFFFRRGDLALSDPANLWLTVAHDLAQRNPLISQDIFETLQKKRIVPSIPDINSHFKFLIQQPLSKLFDPGHQSAMPIIVIDALDECDFDGS